MVQRRTLARILIGLILGVAGCHAPPAGTKLAKRESTSAPTVPPKSVSRKTYTAQRLRYDAISLHSPDRPAFRTVLAEYLIARTSQLLVAQQENEALESFYDTLSLYDPTEIYTGTVENSELDALAKKIIGYFSPRGDEQLILPALCVRISLRPDDESLKKTFAQIMNWVGQTEEAIYGREFSGLHVLRALVLTAGVWPSKFVLGSLRSIYVDREAMLSQTFPRDSLTPFGGPGPGMGDVNALGYKVARMYLYVDQPYEALQRLRELSVHTAQEETLQRLLERAVSPTATIEDQIRLAEHYEDQDRTVALRICRAASERYPDDAQGYACVGRLAATLGNIHLAVHSMEQAWHRTPQNRSFAEALAVHYQTRLFQLVEETDLTAAQKQLEKIETFYPEAEEKLRGDPLQPSKAGAYYAYGYGLYNAGRLGEARKYLALAIEMEGSPEARIQLATIALKSNQFAEGEKLLDAVADSKELAPMEKIYWSARVETLRGDLLLRAQKPAESRAAFLRALGYWKKWLRRSLPPNVRAEGHLAVAKAFYGLGQLGRALDAMDSAIDVSPERKETYADVLALLTQYGHLPEALDVYHRALGREEVTEYLKAYCSFWVVGLARRAKVPPPPLAVEYMRTLDPTEWYAQLAMIVQGTATYDDVIKHAKTPGENAEVSFYWADALLAAGKIEEAKFHWRKVIDTHLMAFFEYDIADYNLRVGPPTVRTIAIDRTSPAPGKPRVTADHHASRKP